MLLVSSYYMSYDTHIANAFIYLLFYFIKLRTEVLNQKLDQLNRSVCRDLDVGAINHLSLELMSEHNNICAQIIAYNKFWRKYLLYLLLSLIPLNLFFLNQVLFKSMQLIPFLLNCTVILISWGFVFFVSFCASIIPKLMTKTADKVFRLQMTNRINAKTKLKIMSCYERVGHKRIGFTVGTLFTMTNTALFKVILGELSLVDY